MKRISIEGRVKYDQDVFDERLQVALLSTPGDWIEDVNYGVAIARFMDSPNSDLYQLKARLINTLEPAGWSVNSVNYDTHGNILIDSTSPRF